jgi:acyl-CoA oxidase
LRGASIAEGDTLVTCIRMCIYSTLGLNLTCSDLSGLASELLLGRYELPAAQNPKSLLARHEAGLFKECRSLLKLDGSNHRSEEFNNLLLPRCLPLIESIGHRMAYDAAVKHNVDPDLIALYETGVMKLDSSWYVEHAGISRFEQSNMESRAATVLLPRIEQLIEKTGSAPYVNAPIVSEDRFTSFIRSLPTFTGNAAQIPLTTATSQGMGPSL